MSYKEYKAKKAKDDQKNMNGQTTLTNGALTTATNGVNGAAHAPPTSAGTDVHPGEAMEVDMDDLASGDAA